MHPKGSTFTADGEQGHLPNLTWVRVHVSFGRVNKQANGCILYKASRPLGLRCTGWQHRQHCHLLKAIVRLVRNSFRLLRICFITTGCHYKLPPYFLR